ncbi:conserved hypothetical protein [Ricinus communis]|uniref:Uncharacterized protein n=1 Tax=Ricinus communis TaxID=3988 RepID=B9TA23_RICCO|nr:conserved hypothetical protein [Ricinus communis]
MECAVEGVPLGTLREGSKHASDRLTFSKELVKQGSEGELSRSLTGLSPQEHPQSEGGTIWPRFG